MELKKGHTDADRHQGISSLIIISFFLVTISCLTGTAISQAGGNSPHKNGSTEISRSATLLSQRKAKAARLKAPEQGRVEKGLLFIEHKQVIKHLRYGYRRFFLTFGGLSTRSGTALGLRYRHEGILRNSDLFWAFTLSTAKYQQYEVGFDTEPFSAVPLGFGFQTRYRNFSREEFFGTGPGSSKNNRTNFRLEDFLAQGRITVPLFSFLAAGLKGGWRTSRASPGSSDRVRSLEETFTTGEAGGFEESIEHRLVGFELKLDLRDSPGNPRSGVSFDFDHTFYNDNNGDRYDFRMTEAEFQGYLPFFHKHRVVAIRVRAEGADGTNGGEVPFHLLPYTGGSQSIRGFREYRFRDRKSIIANLEYRFEAFIGLDVAFFGDIGQVRGSWDGFRLSDFERSFGGGLRFNTAESVFMRLDLGHSREGTRFYWKFNNVF